VRQRPPTRCLLLTALAGTQAYVKKLVGFVHSAERSTQVVALHTLMTLVDREARVHPHVNLVDANGALSLVNPPLRGRCFRPEVRSMNAADRVRAAFLGARCAGR
jgi:hypothetical protein